MEFRRLEKNEIDSLVRMQIMYLCKDLKKATISIIIMKMI